MLADKLFAVRSSPAAVGAFPLYQWGLPALPGGTTAPDPYYLSPTALGSSWRSALARRGGNILIDNDYNLYLQGMDLFFPYIAPSRSWSAIAAGGGTGYGITADGKLYGWGASGNGLLVNLRNISRSSPVLLGPSSASFSWTSITSARRDTTPAYTLAIRSDGTLWGWGSSQYGTLVDTTLVGTAFSSPTQIGTSSWTQVSAGTLAALAIRQDGTLWGWGANALGQLGQTPAAENYSWTMIAADGLAPASRCSVLGIRDNGTLWGWGVNSHGQLGLNNTTPQYSPVQIGTSSWSFVTMNLGVVAAIRSDGTLWMWGDAAGANGLHDIVHRSSPIQVGTISNWKEIRIVGDGNQALGTAVAVRTTGELYTWGYGLLGILGNNATGANVSTPTRIGTSSWTTVSAGYAHIAAIRSDGALFTWGGNFFGELGVTTGSTNDQWTDIAPVPGGVSHQAAIRSDGGLFTWGLNSSGQLGQNNTTDRSSPVQVGTSSWTAVAVGIGFTLAIRSDGALFTWGLNNSGQLGLDDLVHRSSPVQVGTSSWSSVAATDASFAIRSDGALFVWGRNNEGQHGQNDLVHRSSPVQVGTSSWSTISVNSNVVAIRSDGALFTWGDNTNGVHGLGDVIPRSSPVQIGTSSWTAVAVGQAVAAVRSDGTLWGWGASVPSLETPFTHRSSPVIVAPLSWTSVAAGSIAGSGTIHAIRSDGTLWGGGFNTWGQLGDGSVVDRSWRQIGDFTWSKVRGGRGTTFAIKDQELWVWGLNQQSQLGLSQSGFGFDRSSPVQLAALPAAVSNRSSPVQIGIKSWSAISASRNHTLAIRSDGRVFAWGRSSDTNTSWTTYPELTEVQYKWKAIRADACAIAIREDDTLWAWGANALGQLGDNTVTLRSSPVQIGMSSWTQISGGISHTAAIRSDGALFMWGGNGAGQLGLNDRAHRSSPVQIGTSSWTAVFAAGSLQTTMAIRSDGALFTWGAAGQGQLGQSDTISRSSPVQVGTSSWSQLPTGQGNMLHVGAIRSDGALFMWGNSSAGQLGQNNLISSSSPVQVGILTSWTSVTVFNNTTAAIRSDGALFAWGEGASGQTGQNNVINRSSPVQVGASSWSQVGGGYNAVIARRIDDTLWGWGQDVNVQLAQGGNAATPGGGVNRSSPVFIASTNSTWSTFDVGQAVGGIAKNGSLWMWGSQTTGVLGDKQINTSFSLPSILGGHVAGLAYANVHRSSPVMIALPGTSWTKVFTLPFGGAAIRSDGALWMWGSSTGRLDRNPLGQTVGLENLPVPVQIGVGSWAQVASVPLIINDGQAITATYLINNVGKAFFTYPGPTNSGRALLFGGGRFDIGSAQFRTFGIQPLGQILGTWSPIQIGTSSWSSVSVGDRHVHAIRSDGTLWAWGGTRNIYTGVALTLVYAREEEGGVGGFLGVSTETGSNSPIQVSTSSWTKVAAGWTHAAAIRSDGALFTWGWNDYGQIGDNNMVHRSSPVQVGTSSWTTVDVGQQHTLAIRNDGSLWSWGGNTNGQLGITSGAPMSWTFIDGGFQSVAAIRQDGGLFVWGQNNAVGHLGLNDTAHRSSPTQVGTSSWTMTAVGFSHAAAIRTDGALFVWGRNNIGQLGQNNLFDQYSSPVQVGTSSWTTVSVGGQTTQYTAAIRSDGALFVWGSNTNGQLGQNDRTHRSSPVQVGTSSWIQVQCDINGTVAAIRSDGALFVWGSNNAGQHGQNDVINRSSPVQVGTSSWASVRANASSLFAIRSDGTLWGWGLNTNGVLGLNDQVHRSSPVQISAQSWSQVIKATDIYYTTFAIRNDGTVWGWGTNNITYPFDPAITAHRSSPVQLSTTITWSWTQIAQGGSSYFAIRQDGTLWGWGSNVGSFGALGVNDNVTITYSSPVQLGANGILIHRSSPTQVAAMASWSSIAAGQLWSLAVASNATLWGWGQQIASINNLGIEEAGNRSAPTQIGNRLYTAAESPIQVGAAKYIMADRNSVHYAAIRLDGTLWTWGRSDNGRTGLNDVIHRSSPTQVGLSTWSTLAIGQGHMAAIRSDGTLWAWGTNLTGQLGEQQGVTYSWASISTGMSQQYAIRSDGSLWAWGANHNGELGQNDLIHRSSPVQIGTSSWTAVAGTQGGSGSLGHAAFAIRTDGALFAWGDNTGGRLGLNDRVHRSSPVQIGTSSWTTIASGWLNLALAIRSDGALFAWGSNTNGQLGLNDIVHRSSPVQIGTSSWTAITAGPDHAAAIRSDSTLWVWGNNNNGQLGQNDAINRSSPVQIGTGSWKAVDAGLSFTAAIRSDDTLWTWGNNTNGQLGEVVGTLRSWTIVSIGPQLNSHTLAIRQDGSLWAWGLNLSGQHGLNDLVARSSPVQVGTSSWTAVSAGNQTTLAIRSDGALFAWGGNASGQLGTNDLISRSSPVQIGTSSWTQVVSFGFTSLAIRSDGALFAWGNNGSPAGLVGDNTTIHRSSPVQIGTSSWSAIGASAFSAFAIRSDGTLWGWGFNGVGALGVGDRNHRSSPTQIGTDTNWYVLSTGGHFAIKTNGTLWGWGENDVGLLGVNDNAHRSSPVQIPGSWVMVDKGRLQHDSSNIGKSNSVVALKSDGTMWAWGAVSGNKFGDDGATNTHRSSPVQIGTSSWSMVSAGSSAAGAIRSDGTLWMWGADGGNGIVGGVLGDSNTTALLGVNGIRLSPVVVGPHISVGLIHRSSPVQVGVGDPGTWSKIAAAGQALTAISTTNKLFGWGLNSSGQLGQGNTNSRSSPVQVSLSNWSQISAAAECVGAIRSDNTLWTWGANQFGITGTSEIISRSSPILVGVLNPTIERSSPVQVGNSADTWKTVACGGSHTIAIKSDNTLWGWGSNGFGQLGLGDQIHRSSPTQISSSAWTAIGVGISHTIALRSDGTLWSIGGTNSSGELGLTRGSLFSWTYVTGSSFNNAAIRSDGTLWVWGAGTWGIPGQDDQIARSSPVQVAGSWSTVDIAASHILAIRSDGALFAWGGNGNGELGLNDLVARSSPVQVGTSSWTKVFAGINLSAAIRSDGRLFMWGFNNGGNVGDGTTIHRSSPVQVGTSSWAMIATSKSNWSGQSDSRGRHVIGLRYDGTLWGWGDNYSYGLGRTNGGITPDNRSSPVQIGSDSSWTQVSTNGAWQFAVDSSNRLWGWGAQIRGPNSSGQVSGQNAATELEVAINLLDTTSPVVYSWSTVAAGDNTTAAIRSDGSLWTWGSNGSGQLGLGDRNHRSSPVQIGTSSWTAVIAGQNVMLAIRSDGALFGWGSGSATGLGDGTSRSSPVQVGTSSWTAISTASQHVLAIRSDGSLFAWGAGTFGALGNSSENNQSSPVQIGTSSWTAINAGWATSGAIRSDGALFMWGRNDWGQLGQNDRVHRSSPVQIGTSSWSFVSTSLQTTGAIRSDNSLFMWGRNSVGALGQGDTVHRSSPVQVPGKSVKLLMLTYSTLGGDPSVLFTTQDDRLWFMGSGYEGKNWVGQQNATSPILLNSVNGTNIGLRGSLQNYNLFRAPKAFSVSNGGTHVGTITNDDLLFIWGGSNTTGHLGINYTMGYFFQNQPVLIGGPQRNFHLPVFLRSNVVQVAAESGPVPDNSGTPTQILLVKTTTGTIEGWGYNTAGSLGTEDRIHRSTFTQIGTSSWTTISSAFQMCAIRSDGLLHIWGNLFYGGLDSQGSTATRSSPTIVGMLPAPISGINSVSRSSPIQIGLGRSWVLLNTGDVSTFAVDNEYTLWGWGYNSFRFDSGGGGHRSSPVQVSTLKSWVALSSELNIINASAHINGLLKS